MDNLQITSDGDTYTCDECKNKNVINNESKVGDIIECEHCGIEYRIESIDKNDNFVLEILEEEK